MYSKPAIFALTALVSLAVARPQDDNPTASITDSAAATDATPVPQATPGLSFNSSSEGVVDIAAAARGAANIRNHCNFPVYVYTCYQPTAGQPNGGCTGITTIRANGGTYSQPYTNLLNNGQSLKISPQNGEVAKPILQLEYTVYGSNNKISYDLSEVNGNPFGSHGGFTLTSNNGQCFSASCPPPSTSCPGVFTNPTNGVPHDCPIGSSIGTDLCSSQL